MARTTTAAGSGSWVAIVLALTFVVGPLALLPIGSALGWFKTDFWLGGLANLAATSAGIMGGIPAALAINRWQEDRSGRLTEQQRTSDALRKRDRILGVLRVEFSLNEQLTKEWKEALAQGVALSGFFLTERWSVLKAAGELAAIDDVGFLGQLADCYQRYEHFNAAASRMLDVLFAVGMDVRGSSGKSTRESAKERLTPVLKLHLEDVESAHQAVRSKLIPPLAATPPVIG